MDSISAYNSIVLPDTTVAGQNDLSVLLQQAVDSVTAVLQPLDPTLGVVGQPLPYTIKSDSLMTLVMLGGLLFFVISVVRSTPFIVKQVKNFFWQTSDETSMSETSTEVRLLLCVALLDCTLLGTAIYLFAVNEMNASFDTSSHLPIIGLYTSVAIGYFLLKALFYTMVNLTLFSSRQNIQFLKSLLLVAALQSMLLFPVILLQIYIGLAQEMVTNICIFIFIFTKLLVFYKSWSIFFRKNGAFFQTFLYFCSLEIAPLLAIGGVLVLLTGAIKVNY